MKAITDGEYGNPGRMTTGREDHLGRAVVLETGDEGVSVVVIGGRAQPSDGVAPGRA